jgi:hypothetical protein
MVKPLRRSMMKYYLTIMMVAALAFGNIVYSRSVTSKLAVQATVLPTLSFRIIREASGLKITKADINKGYIDVSSGTVFTVTTNSMQGYILFVTANRLQSMGRVNEPSDEHRDGSRQNGSKNRINDVFTSVTLYTNGNTYQILPDGSVDVLMFTHGLTPETKRLNYRFNLSASAKEGSYLWPIRLLATPM